MTTISKKTRPVTLFTGQWADLPRAEMIRLAKEMGYDGLELCCWGDHFDVRSADQAYCDALRTQLRDAGMECHAISSHLVGQAVCDRIDERHRAILPPHVWGDGDPEGVRKRAAEELKATAAAAKRLGVSVVNGFTGSSIWHLMYSFPPVLPGQIEEGFADFGRRFTPILDVFQENGVRFALEVHPTEIAFDIASARRALKAVNHHPAFGFNYDPSHFGYQGVDYIAFLYEFRDRIFHVHMKDVAWGLGGEAGVFGGHQAFHTPGRYWDFKSDGRGMIDFNKIIFALNQIGYQGPLSVEWEQGDMDRIFGATESAAYVRKIDYPVSDVVFDAQFAKK